MIIVVPVSFIIRSSVIYAEDNRDFIAVNKDSRYLDLQIRFQWFSVCVNVVITIGLIVMTCIAI